MKRILIALLSVFILTGCGSKINNEWTDDDLNEITLGTAAIVAYNEEWTLYDNDGNIYVVDCAYLDQLMADNVNNDCAIEYIVKYYEKDGVRHIVKFHYKIGDTIYQSEDIEEMNVVVSKACSVNVVDDNKGFIGIWNTIDSYIPEVLDKPEEVKPVVKPNPDSKPGQIERPIVNTSVK